MALGTHLGAVHVLDHEGNRIREKLFEKVSYLLNFCISTLLKVPTLLQAKYILMQFDFTVHNE